MGFFLQTVIFWLEIKVNFKLVLGLASSANREDYQSIHHDDIAFISTKAQRSACCSCSILASSLLWTSRYYMVRVWC